MSSLTISSLTMSSLTLRLLGPPQLERDGAPLHITRRRTLAFTIYLAVTGETHHRDALTAFFWPELDVAHARADLRRTIYQVRADLGDEWLISEDETLRFRRAGELGGTLWLDIEAFRQRLAACHTHGHAHNAVCPDCLPLLAEAVALYRNDFLAGFSLPDSPAFDDWQFFQGETLRNELASALERLVQGHTAQDAYATAIAYARRWLALDPLHEPVHRWLMQLYAWNDQQAAALRQYQQCVQLLHEELGATPDPATEQLYRAIRTHRLAPALVLPRAGDGFENRESDPAAAALTVSEDDIRVVTVVSIGLLTTPPVLGQGSSVESRPTDDPAATPSVDWKVDLHIDAVDTETLNQVAAESAQLLTLAERIGTRYGGQIERVVGEDILLLFGTLHAHEDDAERGVRVAWLLYERAAQVGLTLHIGISTGMAYCRRSGSGEVAVLGPTVDWATRLRNRARTGAVLVDRDTYRATRGVFAYAPQFVTLPNTAAAHQAYQVLQPHQHARKARGIEGLRASLVGRQAEFATLCAALHKATQGAGQLVALVGTAGVGKSRLISELKAYTQRTQIRDEANSTQQGNRAFRSTLHSPVSNLQSLPLWLEGRGVEFAGNTSYWLIADLLRGFFSTVEESIGGAAAVMPKESAEHALASTLLKVLHGLAEQGQLATADVEEIAALLGQLLAVRFGNGWDLRLQIINPEQMHARIVRAVVTFVAALTQIQPVVLVFEDLHWADAHSLEMIRALLDLLPTHRLLLLCVYRPEQTAVTQLMLLAQQRYPQQVTAQQLLELTADESQQFVASLLSLEQVPMHAWRQLLAKAQGNPFFLEETVRSLIDSGVLYRAGTAWRIRPHAQALPVATGVQTLIISRADALAPTPHRVLQMASVLGRFFQPRVLAAMAPAELDRNQLDAALATLTAQAFLSIERMAPVPEYAFHHVLVRDAIYQDLPKPRRTLLHQQAAQALESLFAHNREPVIEQLAYHYGESEMAEKAVEYLLLAGQKALRTYANDEALAYFRRAQTVMDQNDLRDPRRQLESFDGIGQVYATLGDLQQGEPYLRQAIALAQTLALPAVAQVQRYFPLCHLLSWHGQNDAMLALVDEGLHRLGSDLTTPEAVMLVTLKSDVYFNRGQHRCAMTLMAQVVDVLPELAYSRHLLSAYNMIAMWSRYRKQVEAGFALLATIEAKALAQQDHWLIGHLHGWPVLFLYETVGDLAAAERSLCKVEAMAAQTGDELLKIQATTYRGAIHGWCQGQWAVATSYAQTAIGLTEEAGVPRKSVFGYVTLGLAHYSRHAWAEAAATLAVAREAAMATRFRADCARRGDIGLAWSYLHLGRTADAAAIFHEVVAEEEVDIESLHLITCALAGLAAACPEERCFQAHCTQIEAERGQDNALPILQWQAQPAERQVSFGGGQCSLPTTDATLAQQGWQWEDPFGDSTHVMDAPVDNRAFDTGVTIHAANYRDYWLNNLGAPRLLRTVQGNFAIEAVCAVVQADRLAMGGLLLRYNQENYLRLTWNTHAPGEVNFLGCLQNRDLLLGRGAAPDVAQIYLRLERQGTQVRSLYSADGTRWYSVGTVDFPVSAPVAVGVVAIGFVPRYVYPGAHSEGTAVRFSALHLAHGCAGDSASDNR